jgi:hypothetical protein
LATVTEEQLNDLAEGVLAAHRRYLEAQRAYYGRQAEVDEELEQAVVDMYEEFMRADFLHRQALFLFATHPDLDSDYMRFAREVAAKEGWQL